MATQLIDLHNEHLFSKTLYIGKKIHTEIILKHDFFCLECKNLIILQEGQKGDDLMHQTGKRANNRSVGEGGGSPV